ASTTNSIGLAYLGLKRYDEAYEYFSEAYMLDHLLNKPAKEAADLTNMCYALHGKGDRPDSLYHKALKIGIQAMDLCKKLDNKQLMITSIEAIALSLVHLKRYDESMRYQQQALSMAEELGSNPLIAEQLYLIAQLYNYKGEYIKAIEYGLKSEQIAKEESLYMLFHDIYNGLTTSYEKTGNWRKAFEYSKKLNEVLDSTYQTQIAEQLKRFESEKKDNQINLLSSENELKEKQNQLLKAQNKAAHALLQRNRIFLVAAIIFIALLTALLYVLDRNRKTKIMHIRQLKHLNEELNKQKEEILRVNNILELKALRAQMNPHFIFNCMSSIQECMLTGRTDDANTYLSKLSRLLRMVLEYSDDESVSLDKELEMLQLYLMLESVRLKEGFNYEIKVSEDIFPEEIKVPTLILQPFAENAIWHGLLNKKANRKLSICIDSDDDLLTCIIEDNGIGRQQAMVNPLRRKHESKGIKLIEKRLQIINGNPSKNHSGIVIEDLYNDGKEASGTKVKIMLPLLLS
ncbi:MAG: histidine kinase, partial [Chitinophagales bacterium]|nr:histidine kinase [Chitinophagales bacterium]